MIRRVDDGAALDPRPPPWNAAPHDLAGALPLLFFPALAALGADTGTLLALAAFTVAAAALATSWIPLRRFGRSHVYDVR
jgi:hypothetical protein